MKKSVIMFLVLVLFLYPVSAVNMYNHVYNGSSWVPSLATADGQQKYWIQMNNATYGEVQSNLTVGEDVKISGNLNVSGISYIGQKINFFLGETIDNLIDGWVKITGNLNVTGDMEVGGNFVINNSDLFVNVTSGNVGIGTDNVEATTKLKIDGGWGALLLDDNYVGGNTGIQFKEAGAKSWRIYADGGTDRFYIIDKDDDNGVYLDQDATSWTANSDIRLKENIKTIPNALDRLHTIRGITYNFKNNSNTEIGVIAQEVNIEFPEIVNSKGDYWGVNYDRIGPILIEAIKELNTKNNLEFQNLKQENNMRKQENNLMKQDLCGLGVERWC